ncbi:hypothetical protein VTN49DRAFT_2703 [Thermomyces lanuginosus]|uniref:uncharacterized protein n=1 Tax=Thermomyces lanuginosus TaxID=5541 RepID=UPI003743BEA8
MLAEFPRTISYHNSFCSGSWPATYSSCFSGRENYDMSRSANRTADLVWKGSVTKRLINLSLLPENWMILAFYCTVRLG